MSKPLDRVTARIKSARYDPRKKLTKKQAEAIEAQLYRDGRDAMRRELNGPETERALRGEGRIHFLQAMGRVALDIRPERVKKLREMFGDREAAFREGRGFEAWYFLNHLPVTYAPYRPTAEQAAEDKIADREWLQRQGLIR